MLRLTLACIVIIMLLVGLWGSRDFCDCTTGDDDGIVGRIGWKGLQRIANDVGKRDRLLESCKWVCGYHLPVVDMVLGSR